MDLLAEQSVKVCDQFMKRLINRHITNLEKELLRRSVRGCAREDHPVRNILRMFHYSSLHRSYVFG